MGKVITSRVEYYPYGRWDGMGLDSKHTRRVEYPARTKKLWAIVLQLTVCDRNRAQES